MSERPLGVSTLRCRSEWSSKRRPSGFRRCNLYCDLSRAKVSSHLWDCFIAALYCREHYCAYPIRGLQRDLADGERAVGDQLSDALIVVHFDDPLRLAAH